MQSEETATRYTSNPAHMLLNFLQVALVGSILLRFAMPYIRESADFRSNQLLFAAFWVACAFYVALRRCAVVTVTDGEVVVRTPRQGTTAFRRGEFSFSHRTVTHTFKNIPLWTDRFLITKNAAETVEISLPNFSRRSFSLLLASLRDPDDRQEQNIAAPAELQAAFTIPKARMVGEYGRFIHLYLAGSAAAMIAYGAMMYYVIGDGKLEDVLIAVVAIGGLEIFFGAFILAAYRRKRRDIPERVAIDGGNLLVGDAAYPLAAIQTIIMTPPKAAVAAFANARMMRIETDFETVRYNLGPRSANGMMKTVFDEYSTLCQTLEKTAAACGFRFAYDL